MTKNCTLCVFAVKAKIAQLNAPLQCLRFPPQMVAIPVPVPASLIMNGRQSGKSNMSLQAMQPIVNAKTICGEFTRVEVANEDKKVPA